MPVHIFGAGGSGGSTKSALSVYFTPQDDMYSYTITIDDVDFARRFNDAKTTKHFDLIFEDNFFAPNAQGIPLVYHAGKGIVNGVNSQKLLVVNMTNSRFEYGESTSMLWDGGFTISGNSASFAISFVSGVAFSLSTKYRATWICEE